MSSPVSSPSGNSLIRRSRALPLALVASVVGLLICGITYAVAGETVHTRDIDLIYPLPDGVVVVSNDVQCNQVPGTGEEMCRRRVVVRRDGMSADQLAEELQAHYNDRGFVLTAVVAGNGRTYFGSFGGGSCQPQLFVAGPQAAGSLPGLGPTASGPARRDRVPTTPPTAGNQSTTVTTTPAAPTAVDPAAADGAPVVPSSPEPAVSGEAAPTETAPTETAPTEAPPAEAAPTETATTSTTNQSIVPPETIIDPAFAGGAPSAGDDLVTLDLSEPYPGMC